jgi:hypothetical protein
MKALIGMVCLLALCACNADTTAPSPSHPPLPAAPPPPPMPDEAGSCPADVNQCTDGSYVSRNPARGCAFNPCPGEGNK